MITKEQKAEMAKKYGKSPQDTGCAEVQIAILTARINELSGHFSKHKHDYHGRRGLMKLIGQRRRKLKYLQAKNAEGYSVLIKDLGLRK